MSALPDEVTLSNSGLVATLSKDRFTSTGVVLSVDGIAQSQVNPEDPSDLQFEYIRRIGHLIDLFRPEGSPITAVHLGAGALSVPRYVSHTRPGSRSQVLEWEPQLIELVRKHIPWDAKWSIRVRYGDARDTLVTGDDCFFVATGITDGELLEGVRYSSSSVTTESLVMRSRSGTIRTIRSEHQLSKLRAYSAVDFDR